MSGSPLDTMISQAGQNRNSSPTNAPAASTPTSFFSAASPITSGASSRGASPFGALIPDLSKATPEQLSFISKTLSNLTYSAPRGGYLTTNEANDSNSVFNRGYYNYSVGSDANADRLASNVYDLVGSFPTRPVGTQALNSLPGYTPSQGQSYNDRLGKSYGGPFAFPNFRG